MVWGAIYLHLSQDIPNYPYRSYTPTQWYYGYVPTFMYITADYGITLYLSIIFNFPDSLGFTSSYNVQLNLFHINGYYEYYKINLYNGSRTVLGSGTVTTLNQPILSTTISNLNYGQYGDAFGITYKRTSSSSPTFGFNII
jgi:hypothetical protein